MRRTCLCVVLLLALCNGSWAQAPNPSPALSITGATNVPENGLVQLTLTPSPTSVAWLVMPDVSQYSSGTTLVFAGPPGSYTAIALAVNAGQPTIAKTTVTITPANQVQPLAIAIFDPLTLASLPAGQAAIYQSTTIASSLASQGVTWLQYQVGDQIPSKGGSVPVISTTWGSAAAQVGYPALVTDNHGVVSAVPLPATQAAIITQLLTLKRPK